MPSAACHAASQLAACFSSDNRISVLSLTAGIIGRHVEPDHLVVDITALALAKPSKASPAPLLAFGRADGSILIVKQDGSLLRKIHLANIQSRVSCLHFTSSQYVLAAWADHPTVHIIDVNSGLGVTELEADSKGVSCVAANADGTLLATARTGIKVWTNKGTRAGKLTGHASNVTCMTFCGSALVSCSEDRLISVWPPMDDAALLRKHAKAPIMLLVCSGPPRSLRSGPALRPGDEASVLATTPDGKLLVWRLPSSPDTAGVQTLNPSVTVAGQVLAGDFVDSEKLMVLRGTASLPQLATVTIQASDELIANVHMTAAGASASAATSAAGATARGKAKMTRLDRTADAAPAAASNKRAHLQEEQQQRSVADDDRPMDERLHELATRWAADEAPAAATAPAAADLAQGASSLARALEQGLQTRDQERIEAVLQTTDQSVIASTVSRLATGKVTALVEEIVLRFRGKPGRAPQLMRWLKPLLHAHAQYLSQDEGARKALRELYKIIDVRLAVFDPLLRLHGRLALAMSLPAGQGAGGGKAGNASQGPLVFVDAAALGGDLQEDSERDAQDSEEEDGEDDEEDNDINGASEDDAEGASGD